eukprot:g58277.t1
MADIRNSGNREDKLEFQQSFKPSVGRKGMSISRTPSQENFKLQVSSIQKLQVEKTDGVTKGFLLVNGDEKNWVDFEKCEIPHSVRQQYYLNKKGKKSSAAAPKLVFSRKEDGFFDATKESATAVGRRSNSSRKRPLSSSLSPCKEKAATTPSKRAVPASKPRAASRTRKATDASAEPARAAKRRSVDKEAKSDTVTSPEKVDDIASAMEQTADESFLEEALQLQLP